MLYEVITWPEREGGYVVVANHQSILDIDVIIKRSLLYGLFAAALVGLYRNNFV